ncbi:acyl-CoA dehydrogenase family protein [Actinocorallia sp. A-T 12471]|uniref:acyl-CoA dehydrogenase family protein n=1 Tax=Actinocorallia sp. A-T 12471 TaxID=3089813 RepID=UPI0029D0F579|nr:acyl-CoA dehydrogenase family protein [Actinocorallia sp. A-T 12471]MDX6745112.1 acyl-CoA dehydrogenase family protein [Actinocorallia sp. A-T 12471]
MNIDLSEEAFAYGREAQRALGAAGGDELVKRAEADPASRAGLVEPLLGDLGAWDLDPRGDADDLEAAAALSRAFGYWAAPYPIAERLARPAGSDGLVVVADRHPEGAVAGLDLRWTTVTLDGARGVATAVPSDARARDTAFVTALDVRSEGEADVRDVALGLVLPCWTLLGMLDRAMELTREHVLVRRQFGKPLADKQGVQFQLTDAEVERAGVAMLARYALWSVQDGRAEAVHDALALRLAVIEAAETVLRTCHLLHGAVGFCDEAALSWISRYSQPLRRLPYGVSGTGARLARSIGRDGLTGLFSEVTA